MPIAFSCPHCGHAFEVADSYAGNTGPCAACGETITIPGTANAFAASAGQDSVPQKSSSAPLIIGILAGGLVVVLLCAGILAALLLPAISAAREAARLAQCKNNGRMLAMGFHELNAYNNRLPLASSKPVTGIPGKGDGPNPAGYSWTVALLPYLENQVLFDDVVENDPELTSSPFDPASAPSYSATSARLVILECPSSWPMSDERQKAAYHDPNSTQEFTPLGTTNFIVLPSTHLTRGQGPLALADQNAEDAFVGNGVIVFPAGEGQKPGEGIGMESITDGLSETILFCETREPGYSAWVDGQATWAVGVWPGSADQPTFAQSGTSFINWGGRDSENKTSLATGQAAEENPEMVFLKASRIGGPVDRQFGPSSSHPRGVVVHGMADGAVRGISPDIDRNTYLRLITREGSEVVNPAELNYD